jgi:hypothetical protein
MNPQLLAITALAICNFLILLNLINLSRINRIQNSINELMEAQIQAQEARLRKLENKE